MVKNTPIDVSSLKGAYVALITPMKFDDPSGMFNSIDYDKLEQIIEDQIDAGIDGILVNGTTGQSPTLDKSEIVQLSKRSCEIINGRIPLMVGAGSNSTNTAVQLTNAVEREIDSTTFLHVTGPYNKPTSEGLRRHFKMIANHFLYSEGYAEYEKMPQSPFYNFPSSFLLLILLPDKNHPKKVFF